MQAMVEDLKEFDNNDIETAFRQWRQENEKIPTPAGIRKICIALRSQRLKGRSGFRPQSFFAQVVREKTPAHDGQVLAEYFDQDHKSLEQLEKIHGNKIHVAYRKIQNG